MSVSPRWVAVFAIAATLSLSACSAGAAPKAAPTATPKASSQSTKAACDILGKPVGTASANMASIATDMTKHPAKAESEMQALADAFGTGLKGVQNAKVLEAGSKTQASLESVITELKAVKSTPTAAEATKLVSAASEFEQDFSAVATLCG